MSVKDKFRSRKFRTVFVIVTALVICAIIALSVMLPSWTGYKSYYDAAIADREYKKYLNSLPLELTGITANLAPGVEYFDNGKAAPTADDFEVMAHFTEKGKARDEMLMSGAFTIEVPAGFAESGGTIVVRYEWTPPEAESAAEVTTEDDTSEETGDTSGETGETEGETTTPATVVKTAEVPVTLTPVTLKRLTVTENPYLIYYGDDQTFNAEGIEAIAEYNDGTVVPVYEDDLTVKTTGTLAAGTTSATVAYGDGESEITADVPITVVPAKEYKNGAVVAIDAGDEVYLTEGADVGAVSLNVLATYESGNRMILGDKNSYTVSGNVATASYTKNCVLTVTYNENQSIIDSVAAKVRNGIDTEDATKTGGDDVIVTGWTYNDDGALVEESEQTTAVEGASRISFVLDNKRIVSTDFSVRVANRTEEGGAIKEVNLASVMSLTVNGRYVPIDRHIVLGGQVAADKDKYVFTDVTLPDLALNYGANEIVLTFGDSATLAIDRLDLSTKYEGRFYNSLLDYTVECAQTKGDFTLDIEKVKDWGRSTDGKPYANSMCSDGEYLYIAYSTSSSPRVMSISKYDPETDPDLSDPEAVTATTTTYTDELHAGVSYYDGKIILFNTDGSCVYVPADFSDGAEFQAYDGFVFKDLGGAALRDVCWSETAQRFAVRSDFDTTAVRLYDADKNFIASVKYPGDPQGLGALRMTCNDDYIFINFNKNGYANPAIHVFSWTGSYISRVSVPNTLDLMNEGSADDNMVHEMSGDDINVCYNTHGIAFHDGDLYFSVIKWLSGDGGPGSVIMRVSPDIPEDRAYDLDFGEFLASCTDDYYTPAFSATPVTGDYGQIENTSQGYTMGGVSYGGYIYIAVNSGAGNTGSSIYKIDPTTYEVVCNTASVDTNIPRDENDNITDNTYGDNSQLMIKDGVIYMFTFGNKVYSIPVADITNISRPTEATDLPFDVVTSSSTERDVLKGAYWSEETGRYAVIDYFGNMFILKENGTQVGETIKLKIPTGLKAATSVTGDDKYIYVAYTNNNQASVPVDVYTWDGKYVATGAPEGLHLRENVGTDDKGVPYDQGYNVQSIFFHNGEMYATVCTWQAGMGGAYLWKLSPDYATYDQVVPTRVTVDVDEAKTVYFVGESFDTNSVTMTVHYSDGSSKPTTDFTVSPATFTTEGEFDVKFTCSEGSATLVADVSVRVTVSESVNFGDYVVGNGDTFTVTSVSGNTPLAPNPDITDEGYENTFTMGGASHGDYVYVAMKNEYIAKVIKLDPKNDFSVVAKQEILFSASIPNDWCRLFVKGDTLYFIINSGDVYSIYLGENGENFKTGTLDYRTNSDGVSTPDGVVTFDKATLPFAGTCAAWNETLKRYAVLNGNSVYLYDESGVLVTGGGITNTLTPADDVGKYAKEENKTMITALPNVAISSVTSDDKYIYVSFRANNQQWIPIVIYDWDGNYVGECKPQDAGYPTASYNAQAIFEYNGTIYATICSFARIDGGGAGRAMFLWSIVPTGAQS